MLIAVARVDCPVCRSAGLVFAVRGHSGKERCLCGRCGLMWIAPDPVTMARLDDGMTSSPQRAYPSTDEDWPRTSTVIGTYTYTH
jgi:hypothetical protein